MTTYIDIDFTDSPSGDDPEAKAFDAELLESQFAQGLLREVDDAEWGNPVPFEPEPLPELPLDLLPDVMRRMVTGVSTETQAPEETAFLAALTTIAAATRGVWSVNIHDGWKGECSVVWGLNLTNPAERKTRTMNPFFKPLEREQQRLVQQNDEDNLEREVEFEIAKRAYNKAVAESNAADAKQWRQKMRESEPLPSPAFIQSNTNPQAAARAIADNGGNLVIKMTEAATFANISGLHNSGRVDVGGMNDWYDGNWSPESRLGGDRDTGTRPTLTFAAAVQPEVMRGFAGGIIEGSGFISRMILLAPDSMVGKRDLRAPANPARNQQDWDDAIRSLFQRAQVKFVNMGGADPQPPYVIEFEAQAAERLTEHLQAQEYAKRSEARLIRLKSWVERQGGRVARIAALFTLFEDVHATTVPLRWLEVALALDSVLIAHADEALRVLRNQSGDSVEVRGQQVLAAICSMLEDGRTDVSKNDIYKHLKRHSWVNVTADIDEPLRELEERNYVRVGRATTGGRVPVTLNPKYLQ